MTTGQMLLHAWDWEPSVLVGRAALLAGYAVVVRPLTARAALFVAGIVVLLVALLSPIDVLGDGYLFSAHMLQHLLLELLVPPLLLLGIPPWAYARLLQWTPAERAERVLGRPLLAWPLGVGMLWVWHAPALYDLALRSQGVHIVQHLMFLATATIFWWPVIAPVPERRRLLALAPVPYLIAAGLSSSLLGIILTFSPTSLYAPYLHPIDRLGLLPLIRQGWGLSAGTDHQLGGLLMWVLSSPVFLLSTAIVLARWYYEPEPDLEQLERGDERRDDVADLAGAPAPRARSA